MPRLAVIVLLCSLPASVIAQEAIDYRRDIRQIFKERCVACHGPLKQNGRLRLDSAGGVKLGGKHGSAVAPGQPAKSLLLERVTAAPGDDRMPPEGEPLTAKQIALLRKWIEQGAKAPADDRPEDDPRAHWAFQKPVRAALPAVKNAAWVRNPIDAFISTVHDEHGLTPAPAADAATLLRRVYIDLTGLPPTPAELHAFLDDKNSDAYERVVDRLLTSPHYAERWARHWLDIWRYSDWYGSRHINELRNSQRHIWRWRDWLIESLDEDKGYDRLILEMLAADEAAPGDLRAQRAGGYLGRNFYVFNRNVWLQDTLEYTAASMLGLSIKCARCHDHKYDPIAQEDYYRFRAFFEPHKVRTDPIPGKPETMKGNVAMNSPPGTTLKDGLDCVYDADLTEKTFLFARGNDKEPVKDRPLTPGIPAILGGELKIEPVALPVEAHYPNLRPEHVEQSLKEERAGVAQAEVSLAKATDEPAKALAQQQKKQAQAKLASLEARIAAERGKYNDRTDETAKKKLAIVASKAERVAVAQQAELDLLQARQEVAKLTVAKADAAKLKAAEAKVTPLEAKATQARKAALDESSTQYTALGPAYPAVSSGRRLALARWIASKENPLTARVAVNHIWLRHFGTALVPSVQNLGRNGKPPTHPKLLDWLAVEFMEHGWSTKHLHRLIVTSNAYRMASNGLEANQKLDPENRWLWRANVRRMEAEVVRDSLLHLAGRLDPTRGGEDLDPGQDTKIPRRSLYFRHTPDEKPLILELFDAANPSECFERTESIMPQQALALVNSEFCHSQARLMARNLEQRLSSKTTDDAFIRAAFELVLARPPLPEEVGPCSSFLARQEVQLRDAKALTPDPNAITTSAVAPAVEPRLRAWENLVHVLLNYNEFATIR